jgi:ribosomal protein S18 acetylase RimI-like enzyme
MTVLVPMTPTQFDAFLLESVPAYGDDKVAAGQWPPSEALERARAEFDELLPQGLATPDNLLYAITDEGGADVGVLWISLQERAGQRIAYVYDVNVRPERQREGHASRAFAALEQVVRELGLAGIALHVFGHNTGARLLYERLGFLATNISMFKAVGPAGPVDS